jgi:excisionase family DNA binding protein
MNVLEETQLLTVAEVARLLQQSERTVRDKIASGQLPAVKIGTGPRAPLRVDRAELEEWLALSHVTPAERRAPDELVPAVEAQPLAGRKATS